MRIFSKDKFERKFMSIKEIADELYFNKKPLTGHISIGVFDQDIVEYKASNNGSIAEYSGKVFGSTIPIDIDINVSLAVKVAEEKQTAVQNVMNEFLLQSLDIIGHILRDWDDKGVQYYLFFSGNKGFSIYVNKEYFSNKEKFTGQFNTLCKSAVSGLKKMYPVLNSEIIVVDTQPYHKTGMLRAPFTLHEKTDKIKYMLVPIEPGIHGKLSNYNAIGKEWKEDPALLSHILEQIFKDIESSEIKILSLEENFVLPVDRQDTTYDKPFLMENCIWSIWKNGNYSSQGRHQTGLLLASWCAKRRLNKEATLEVLREWNASIDRSMEDRDLVRLANGSHKYYYNFCKQEISLEFCPKNKSCQYFESGEHVIKIMDADERSEAMEQYDNADKSRIVKWSSLFPGLKGDLNPVFGHIGTIGASSGVGKTMIALQLAMVNKHINWIFFSYEQPIMEITKRMRMILNIEGNPEWKRILAQETKHIFLTRDPMLTAQDQAVFKKNLEMIHNVRIDGVISDYMGLIPVRNLTNGKIMYDESDSIPAAAKVIKDAAVSGEFFHIITCQPTKEFSSHGAVILEPEHLKYGQSIQAMSDSQITLCRPNMIDANDCLAAIETKNREGGNRSVSVIQLRNQAVAIPELFNKPYKLYRTADQWIKDAQAKGK